MDLSVNRLPFVKNDTIPLFPKDYETGHNILYNDTETREFHWVVTGKQPVAGKYTDSRGLKFIAHRCIGGDCFEKSVEILDIVEEPRLWSKWSTSEWFRTEDDK